MSKKFFVKLVTDPDLDLRKCVVGLACGAQAIKDGHEVSMFFAANGVRMLNSNYLEAIDISGMMPEGMIFDMMTTITQGAKNIYCSTGSQAANGITIENAAEKLLDGWNDWMTWSGPAGVIELSTSSEIQLIY
jgi:predicted peroxiredoxin